MIIDNQLLLSGVVAGNYLHKIFMSQATNHLHLLNELLLAQPIHVCEPLYDHDVARLQHRPVANPELSFSQYFCCCFKKLVDIEGWPFLVEEHKLAESVCSLSFPWPSCFLRRRFSCYQFWYQNLVEK